MDNLGLILASFSAGCATMALIAMLIEAKVKKDESEHRMMVDRFILENKMDQERK